MQASNFDFLQTDYRILSQIGNMAESYLYSDSNSCLIKLGQFGEILVNYIFQFEGIPALTVENTHANRIKQLKQQGILPKVIDDILYQLRSTRNKAVHTGYDSQEDCKMLLHMCYNLGTWFMRTYSETSFDKKEFELPQQQLIIDISHLLQEKEEQIKQLTQQLAEKLQIAESTVPRTSVQKQERAEKSEKAAQQIILTEAETRLIIDSQLRKVGWVVDSVNLHYSKGTRPQKGQNLAIAEWPVDIPGGRTGKVDYALFASLKLVGIIEAKKNVTDIPAIIDYQCKEYSRGIKPEHAHYQINCWGTYKAPFLFAANGRDFLKQIDTKSGIWFLDARQESNIPKALQGWISPDGLLELLEKDIRSANRKLVEMPYDLLTDKDGLNLRDYQINGIQAAEAAVLNGQQEILLSMATGTGKTRTILGLIYRFLKTERFRRILFLVDRTSLGEQAQDVFSEVRIEDLMTLDGIYNIKRLEDRQPDRETKIQVSTVQSMVKRILYNEEDTMPSVTDYDLIIVDEAHRGYVLDKEMGEEELLYRDQKDYVSKYRIVIEYFDAVKIALTATPALHTSEIFGKPVFEYTYKEAVLDGYLIDHDLPHRITTQLSEEGIHYKKGDRPVIYDPVTHEILNSAELEDELDFDVEQFNRRVITEPFNRTVLEEIATYLNPEGEEGKTLIYAVGDEHADLIVKILKEIYEPYGIDNEAILKITGSVGDKKRVLEAIKRFKNEKYPNIAVTVDLLTTGIDVPEITTLIFMRRVKSRILFEQMLGRATRLCPKINKTHFDIFDPVGVYESLEEVNTMKPVAANPQTTADELITQLKEISDEQHINYQISLLVAKMQRQVKNRSNQQAITHFQDLSGQTPKEFFEQIKNLSASEAKKLILNNIDAIQLLGTNHYKFYKIIDDTPDVLREHTVGYGKAKKPEDYLEEFNNFVNGQINKISALNILCTRPAELTRKSLRSLLLEFERNGFTEQRLNTAWKATKNEDITADIISLIRRYAIGSALISHEERIRKAVTRLTQNHTFSKMELDWLRRIENYLLSENIIDKESFETGAFKNKGGFDKINKAFKNQLEQVITELNQYLYDDGGNVA